ncbi:nucleocapsid protein [alfalfa-associated nucleorhabdovirus]|uniref:Nucleoprotein n=1 Tax=alfalfa-associated nucleorhabdovirus TaxID=2518374 RepID=A0A410HXU3_9RHAB|nr:nucleocapsid protein [alfalfa-associated nucleorhabdovirus]QAB45070.1 nucleocapsid protein [alfalfa-associated nucleorhabdovirus]UBX89814.1 nucleocapsid protein [alfalfa-associated nucleorhabdovirus]
MENIKDSEFDAIHANYVGISSTSKPERPSGQCPYIKFDHTMAKKSPSYKVSPFTNDSVLDLYNSLVGLEREMTESLLWSVVNCGLQIRSPLDVKKVLVEDVAFTGMCEDWATAKPSSTNKVFVTGKFETKSLKITTTGMEVDGSKEDTDESTQDKVCAIHYLCAWLMRYSVKQPGESYKLLLAKMNETYLRMYGKSSQILQKFVPTQQWLMDLNNAFSTFVRVRNTMAIYVSSLEEHYKGSDIKVFNLLRYCFFQNLEFMGMHAYTAMIDIINSISIQTPKFLSWMRMDRMEQAIDEIAEIMIYHDNGMIANGAKAPRLWKYARLINEGYFNRIQTTYNALLVAILAWLKIKLGLAKKEGYDSPLNIRVISSNSYIKEEGEQIASLVIEALRRVKASQPGASVIEKARAGIKRQAGDHETQGTKRARTSNEDDDDLGFLNEES